MKIAIGSDHAGLELKSLIINYFTDINFTDMGTNSKDSCDYPDYISKVGYEVQGKKVDLGIVICGTGIGASISVNKVKGIRGALCFNSFMAEKAKEHNNANVLVLGARIIGTDLAIEIVKKWLAAVFEDGRHQRRIDKIHIIEKNLSE
jgi:ribose 5-phosphate isomerase B